MAESALLTVHGLSHSVADGRGRLPVLRDLALTLQAGEIVAVVGPSGAGKTTLLNLLAGLERPDAGSIRLGDTEVTALRGLALSRWRRRNIGFVFQFFNLIPTLTAAENCLLPGALDGRPASPAAAQQVLERLGLGELAARYPEQLSGGEQQREAIARALVSRPALLLADEPTGNLDTHTADTVAGLLVEHLRAAAISGVIVTHSEALAAGCDRRLVLRDGHLQ